MCSWVIKVYMKRYSNELCVGFYLKDNKRRLTILESPDNLVDIITGKQFQVTDFESVKYDCPSKTLCKYFYHQFLQTNDERVFESTEVYENSFGLCVLPLLRFFNLNYSELFETKNCKQTLQKVVFKCCKYLKRYINSNELEQYKTQIGFYDKIIDVLAFLPENIRAKKVPFWQNLVIEYFGDQVVYPLTSGITNEILEKCNYFEFNLSECLKDFKEFKVLLKKLEEIIEKKTIVDFRETLSCIARSRIKEAKETLQEELLMAQGEKDIDLITEVEMLQQMLLDVENNIEQLVNETPVTEKPTEWWPELLYPAPKLIFEESKEYSYLMHIKKYFIKD